MVAPLMKLNQEDFYKWKKSVLSSDFYNDIIEKRNVTDATKNRYVLSIVTYCMYNNMSIDDLIKEADNEERDNIRIKDRKILKRLDYYRNWLLEQGLQKLTIQTRFNDAKWCYKRNYIEVPELNDFEYPKEKKLKYGDLPTKTDIQKAIDGTNALSNKALFLFMASSGTAKMETSLLTVQDFIDATKEYHNEIDNIYNVLKILDGKNDVIPIFEMHREKTNYDYHTCCSPEATQAIINLLQSQPIIKNDDPLFYLSYNGIAKAFQRANDKHNWGKIRNYHYFSSHRLRKRHASIINNYDLANYLQGRKPDKIRETYFFNNPKKVKEEYSRHINDLSINEVYYKDIYSDEYKELVTKNEELTELVFSQDSEIKRLSKLNDTLTEMITDVETKVDNIINSNDLSRIQEYLANSKLVNENNLTSIIIGYYKEDVKKENFTGVTNEYIDSLIFTAYNTTAALKNVEINEEPLDESWNTIKSSVMFIADNYMDQMGYKLSKSQSNEVYNKLYAYVDLLYRSKDEVHDEHVKKIVDNILIR